MSDSGYTDDKLAMDWLKHFIEKTNSGADKHWKILLMDGHKSHNQLEFAELALANNIEPFFFLSHLTHIMQPLDVGVLRPWKHYQNKAIIQALRNLDLSYSIASFFRDLNGIREETFKPTTCIRRVWSMAS